MLIDAGTAITYDFIEASGIYQGGNIAPGLEMRLKALHHFTGKLPLVSKTGDTPLLGYNTETAISRRPIASTALLQPRRIRKDLPRQPGSFGRLRQQKRFMP